MSASAATDSTVLDMSVARVMKRVRRSAGIAGRGPCRCAAMYASALALACGSAPPLASALRTRARTASRDVRFASDISLMDSGDTSANEVRDARDAFFDRFLRRGVGEAHVLAFAGDATAEVNIGQHRDTDFAQQALAKRLRVRSAGHPARVGDVGPRVKRAPGRCAFDAGHFVQQADDEVPPLE